MVVLIRCINIIIVFKSFKSIICQTTNAPCAGRLAVVLLAQLASHGAGDGQARVDISKEHGGVLFNLVYVETIASVLAIGHDTGLERSGEAADAGSGALAITFGVGESNAAAC